MRLSTAAARRVLLASRIVVAAVSVVVLALTALAWYQVRILDRSTPAAPVIAGPPPAVSAERNILLAGLDSRTDAQGNPLSPAVLDALHAGGASDGGDTTDSLIVVHVPAGGGRATAISIPRDSYVELADGSGPHKINSAYARAYRQTVLQMTAGAGGAGSGAQPFVAPRADDPAVARAAAAAAARATVQSVEALTQLRITNFAAVNLAGFADLSQAIGGVPVCLRAPVDDRAYSGSVWPAGRFEVSGPAALAFVRQRHGLPNGDLDRIARQQAFLAGATEQLLASGTLANPFAMSRFSQVVARSVTLDTGWDVLGFATQLQGLRSGNVTFRTIPTGSITLPTPEDGVAVQVSPPAVRSFIADAIAADAARPTEVRGAAPAVATDDRSARPAGSTPVRAQTAGPPEPPPITAAQPGCVN